MLVPPRATGASERKIKVLVKILHEYQHEKKIELRKATESFLEEKVH